MLDFADIVIAVYQIFSCNCFVFVVERRVAHIQLKSNASNCPDVHTFIIVLVKNHFRGGVVKSAVKIFGFFINRNPEICKFNTTIVGDQDV